jgi:gentisate 1,2-dioxygenase
VALIKDVDSILEGKKVKVRKAGEKFDCTSLMPDDEWYPKAVRTKIRPARWNWKDCLAKLKSIASDPIPGADRRFIILVHNDTEEMMGTAPGALIGMTILNPGEGLKPHRHTSFAIYHVLQGKGFDVMQDEDDAEPTKIEWEKGDTFLCPAWTYHQHVNDGDEQAIILTVQDFPLLAAQRSLLFEEPKGRENIKQVNKKFVPHKDTAGSFKLDI